MGLTATTNPPKDVCTVFLVLAVNTPVGSHYGLVSLAALAKWPCCRIPWFQACSLLKKSKVQRQSAAFCIAESDLEASPSQGAGDSLMVSSLNGMEPL